MHPERISEQNIRRTSGIEKARRTQRTSSGHASASGSHQSPTRGAAAGSWSMSAARESQARTNRTRKTMRGAKRCGEMKIEIGRETSRYKGNCAATYSQCMGTYAQKSGDGKGRTRVVRKGTGKKNNILIARPRAVATEIQHQRAALDDGSDTAKSNAMQALRQEKERKDHHSDLRQKTVLLRHRLDVQLSTCAPELT